MGRRVTPILPLDRKVLLCYKSITMQQVAVTQKGQVTIPVDLRRRFGIAPRTKVSFFEEGGELKIKPAVNFFDLRGSIRTKKPFDVEKMTRAAKVYVAKRLAEKSS